jgi:hypothetical protein
MKQILTILFSLFVSITFAQKQIFYVELEQSNSAYIYSDIKITLFEKPKDSEYVFAKLESHLKNKRVKIPITQYVEIIEKIKMIDPLELLKVDHNNCLDAEITKIKVSNLSFSEVNFQTYCLPLKSLNKQEQLFIDIVKLIFKTVDLELK